MADITPLDVHDGAQPRPPLMDDIAGLTPDVIVEQ